MSETLRGLKPLWFLRWTHFRRRTLRRADNLRVYLHWQAVVIYIYAGAAFLGGPIYYLLVPSLISPEIRGILGLLLFVLLVLLLGWAGYRALFAAADGFPGSVPVADAQFVLPAPVSRAAFLADRLLWGLMQAVAEGLALVPVAWVLGRAFFPHWGWPEAVAAGGLFAAAAMAVHATGLLIYGLPPVLRAVRIIRVLLWSLVVLGGAVVTLGSRLLSAVLPTVNAGAQADAPAALAQAGAALPAAALVHGLLPWAAVWALVAIVLVLLAARPDPSQVAADAVQAERRRWARMTGRSFERMQPGAARVSLNRGWGTGAWAVAWRQFAAYRHLPLSTWPPKILAAAAVMGAPAMLRLAPAGYAGSLVLLAPAMVGVSMASGLMGTWRLEVEEGWTRRLMPVRPDHLVQGSAFWPAVAVGGAGALGVLLTALQGRLTLVETVAGCLVALAGGAVVAMLALHEEWTAASSLTGPAEGRQAAKLFSIVLSGAPALLASEMATGGMPLAMVCLFMTAVLLIEAFAISFYLGFRLSTERR